MDDCGKKHPKGTGDGQICLIALLAIGGFPLICYEAASTQLPAPLIQPPRSIVQKVRVDCRNYRQGNKLVTEYCEDGYVCGADKCIPGPELQKELDEKLATLKAANERIQQQRRAALASAARYERKAQEQAIYDHSVSIEQGVYWGLSAPTPGIYDPYNVPSTRGTTARTSSHKTFARPASRKLSEALRAHYSLQKGQLPPEIRQYWANVVPILNSLPANNDARRYYADRVIAQRNAIKETGGDAAAAQFDRDLDEVGYGKPSTTAAAGGDGVEEEKAGAGDIPVTKVQTPSQPALTSQEMAFCNFLATRARRGELTRGSGTEIPEKCREQFEYLSRAIKKDVGETRARSDDAPIILNSLYDNVAIARIKDAMSDADIENVLPPGYAK